MLNVLSLILWIRITVRSQFMFYDTNYLQLDCLHYYLPNSQTSEIIHYCLRPFNERNSTRIGFLNTRDQNFTFDELHRLNITARLLLLWSASIDRAEQYQYYIDQQNKSFLSNEIFFNCTKPWFGSQCQYAFELNETISKIDVVETMLDKKLKSDSTHLAIKLTCYILLECVRGSSYICLDWREVCDGRVDCLNGGVDELQCFDLEINECDENEYRCHNGLCIPEYFWTYESAIAVCADLSDTSIVPRCPLSYIGFDIFECEEYSCQPGQKMFSCGDGQCAEDFGECYSGRHILLTDSMSAQGNLSFDCWRSMVCLSKVNDQINGTSCEQLFNSSQIITHLESCETLVQFPTIPVLYGHVYFLYRPRNIFNVSITLARTPDYVCYDERLCDFLTPSFRNGTYTCRHGHEMGFEFNVEYQDWKSIIDSVKPYFRGCMAISRNRNYSQHLSLYSCKNSSKLISKHRIVDGISDCYLNDDEQEFELSCSLNDTFRFKCSDENQCLSPLFPRTRCTPSKTHHNLNEILFHTICDRTVDVSLMTIDGQNHTDETDCENWQCNNIYTRCDGVWNCLDGEDEVNCTRPICPPHSFACISPLNYTLICLPASQIYNEIIDCLGASDESQYCRTVDFNIGISYGFYCLNRCLSHSALCNSYQDCPLNDDEKFCENHQGLCENTAACNRTLIQDVLCQIGLLDRVPFTLETIPTYPQVEKRIIHHFRDYRVESRTIANDIKSQLDVSRRSQRCNHGVDLYIWLGGTDYGKICFCPANYYGDMCQYQNQRVSLTLTLIATNPDGIYTVVVMLISDDDVQQEINSYNQIIYVHRSNCRKPSNIYLLYSIRPKNSSKNYSVRVDIFDKTSLTYIGSWHLKIPFLFLPVNRLAAVLTIGDYQGFSPSHCTLTCHMGTCMKYVNEERFFCRCDTGWSGTRCHIPIHCSDCSPDSICVGSIHNRSICACPLNKFGSRCLLKYSCPADYCKNNGQCVVMDIRMIDTSYFCLCSEQFYGVRCQIPKKKLDISFQKMKIPSYLSAYIYYAVYIEQPEVQSVILKKVTQSQQTITLYTVSFLQIVFVKIDDSYYLAVLHQIQSANISTTIDPTRRCPSINELFNSQFLALPRIRRVKDYHTPCQTNFELKCFFDESYMCLCTLEHHANCFQFNHQSNFLCEHHCQNGGQCLQDRFTCPLSTICICIDCFFGNRCQFYAKGIGLALDDMLRYLVKPNMKISDQSFLVNMSIALTMIMFFIGLVNSTLSILVFRSRESRAAGCGIYLLTLSITTILTMSMLTIKLWFVILTQANILISRPIQHGGCVVLEPVLKIFSCMDNWLSACVAIERAVTAFKGLNFDKMQSKRIARWIILFIILFIITTLGYEFVQRDLFNDYEEQRVWCVNHYSSSIHYYSTIILFFHFITPFFVNLFSVLFIIFTIARQRAAIRVRQSYKQHLYEQFNQHKHLIISPMILVVLSFPRLLISLLFGCMKTSRSSWLYLLGYFLSFIPSTSVFIVFVLPSEFYKKQFKELINSWQRRITRE